MESIVSSIPISLAASISMFSPKKHEYWRISFCEAFSFFLVSSARLQSKDNLINNYYSQQDLTCKELANSFDFKFWKEKRK